MGLRILRDDKQGLAAMYCSTSDMAFGPVFYEGDDGTDADERVEAFLRWCDVAPQWRDYEKVHDFGDRDPRCLTERGLERAYGDWRAQETEQYAREEREEAERLRLMDS